MTHDEQNLEYNQEKQFNYNEYEREQPKKH